MKKLTFLLFIISLTSYNALSQEKITVISKPATIYAEQGENKQFLNFDFLITNNSKDTLSLTRISIAVFNQDNQLMHSRYLDNNGTAPSIQTIPGREFIAGASSLVFNPFTEFNPGLPLHKMVYELTFQNSRKEEFLTSATVSAQQYSSPGKNTFPLIGKILVYDGHDLYSHHRRFDYEFSPIRQLGFSANFMRYAYDFVMLDSSGNQFKGNPEIAESYYGYGKPVYSVADGKVIYASNRHKDNKTFDIPALSANPLELYGNCIAIQHRDGSISIYGHLKQNSLKMKVGELVKAKQEIAAIGLSGSSFFPHLHFEIRNSIKSSAEGIPSYFSNVYLLEGKSPVKLKAGLVETGNVIISK